MEIAEEKKVYTAHFVKFCLVLNPLSEVQRPLQKYSEKWWSTGWLFPCLMLLSSHTCSLFMAEKIISCSCQVMKRVWDQAVFSTLLAYHLQQKFCKAFVALVQVFCLKIMPSLVTVQLPCLMCRDCQQTVKGKYWKKCIDSTQGMAARPACWALLALLPHYFSLLVL